MTNTLKYLSSVIRSDINFQPRSNPFSSVAGPNQWLCNYKTRHKPASAERTEYLCAYVESCHKIPCLRASVSASASAATSACTCSSSATSLRQANKPCNKKSLSGTGSLSPQTTSQICLETSPDDFRAIAGWPAGPLLGNPMYQQQFAVRTEQIRISPPFTIDIMIITVCIYLQAICRPSRKALLANKIIMEHSHDGAGVVVVPLSSRCHNPSKRNVYEHKIYRMFS